MTCNAGTWSGSPSFYYTFVVDQPGGAVLQGSTSNVYTPPASSVGQPVVCIVQAGNGGGAGTARTGTATITANTTLPTSQLAGASCAPGACVLQVQASDSATQGQLGMRATATYEVAATCVKRVVVRVRHGRRLVRRVVPQMVSCRHQATQTLSPQQVSPDVFTINAVGLSPGPVQFSIQAVDDVGNVQNPPLVQTATVPKPPPPPHKNRLKPRSHKAKAKARSHARHASRRRRHK
jgi:hypothetical protein